jgi:multiple sugar transport system substrate-binding protein
MQRSRRQFLLRPLRACAGLGVAGALAACTPRGAGRQEREEASSGRLRIVLKHQPFWGDPSRFRRLISGFEAQHPGVEVVTEPLPNASDVVHQYFLTALEGGSTDFDVFVADVIWVPELARAGWVADLSREFPPDVVRRDFLAGPAEAVVVGGRTFAVPFYLDVGVLYVRRDLVPRAPRTYEELGAFAAEGMRRAPGAAGYLWQGRQYEGLLCNAYEAIWGHGGETMAGGRILLDEPRAVAGLEQLRRWLTTGVSPGSITSAAEEECRRVFQEGRAVFMRNWPYAWGEAQRPGSPVRDRVEVAALPTISGAPGPGALGGYQLALNAHVPAWRRDAAVQLIGHLTSPAANLELALAYGRNPPRRAVYSDARLRDEAPFIAGLLPALERARPRPVTPYYPLIADGLQGELSAIVAGIRSADEGMRRAQAFVDRVCGGECGPVLGAVP